MHTQGAATPLYFSDWLRRFYFWREIALDYEAMASTLEATGNYRVLRKIVPRHQMTPDDGSATKTALFVDVETTGLDPARHEIIELAMVPFTYGMDGCIFRVLEPFHALQEPKEPISAEITSITGITQTIVTGHAIDWAQVTALLDSVDLIIAHNAAFDRQFLERACQAFEFRPWGCSNSQIKWREEGFEGTRLGYLVASAGYFYDRHRALNDCNATIELLSKPLPKSGKRALAQLLEQARAAQWRIFAAHAPFEFKDILRDRGYKWNANGHGPMRSWYKDIADDARDAEIAYLETEIYQRQVDVPMRRIDAYNRFSARI